MEQYDITFFRSKSTIIFQNHNDCFHIIIMLTPEYLRPVEPHFHIYMYTCSKMDLRGYILLFLFLLKNIDCGY